jgi:hypothetical protein
VTEVSVLLLSAAITFYILYVISPFLEHVIGINRREIQIGIQCYHWMGVDLETSVGIRFFVTRYVFSRRHFFNSSMISPFLELGLGIIRRGVQLGILWCHRIGAELKTRVAIRFFVTMVSVLFCSFVATFYNSYAFSSILLLV